MSLANEAECFRFLSLRYRTIAEAEKAGESLKKWRDSLVIRTKLSSKSLSGFSSCSANNRFDNQGVAQTHAD